jgi:sigma-E factor negative regulatory protein RseC
MIKEWATVVSWQNGVALVSCDVKASCSSCASRAGCGSRVLNKLGPQTTHTLSVPSDQPLVKGQKVELGIAEASLLGYPASGRHSVMPRQLSIQPLT